MNEEVRKFMESKLLEDYLLGFTSVEQTKQVEEFIAKYPAVKAKYLEMQDEIEQYAEKLAVPAPKNSKDAIMQAISRMEQTNYQAAVQTRAYKNWAIAAGIIALLSCSLAFLQWNNASKMAAQNEALNKQYQTLKADCEKTDIQYASLDRLQEILKHPATQKVLMEGSGLAANLQTVAFWNNEAKVAHLNIAALPTLPDGHCLQIWADVHGEMINLGVLPNESMVIELPYKVDAESLNITVEPLGGSEHPTVSRLVASQGLSTANS